MADGTVTCPECGARMWRHPKCRCVCGREFEPDKADAFLTGDEKRKLQEGTSASPSKGPQPVTGKSTTKRKTTRKRKASGG